MDALILLASADGPWDPPRGRSVVLPGPPAGCVTAAPPSCASTAPRAASSGPLPELTARETEILDGMRRSDTNGEIAARRHLSPKTVEHEVSRVLAKLGVRTRAEAAALAARASTPQQWVRSQRTAAAPSTWDVKGDGFRPGQMVGPALVAARSVVDRKNLLFG